MDSVRAKRLDAGLLEYLQEALSTLNDPRLSGLTLTQVHCSKGKYHAQAYIDGSYLEAEEQKEAIKALKKATPLLRAYVLQVSGWFKCPHFVFAIDPSLEAQQRLDQLFARIAKA
ncbi:30S ribosome-binding factor RbfA [Helicobacter felis]|uniref:30S ribosome-binding factor RbfA n=1 Tax=Helicobacter felis TaxID=214 RepID=UPI000CF03CFF|nr:30S ribosome-binding factor RbfA [Helicobacter felis]